MTGRIIKGIAGFYYVEVGVDIYECKAKGIFRKDGQKPLVGDLCEITVLDEETKKGHVEKLFDRKNSLIRPAVANVDQALVVFAATDPVPDRNLLDRFLIMMEYQDIPSVIVFNKVDLAELTKENTEFLRDLRETYESAGYRVLIISAREDRGVDLVREALRGKVTTVAGPSGVGKSSLINKLQSDIEMETGEISRKIARGKNTTRHAQLIRIEEDTFICDTPGFSSMLLPEMEKESLDDCFPEFLPYIADCKFAECAHINEPSCAVKAALEEGKIAKSRYNNYVILYDELKNRKRW